jgi:hypothetical protein
MQQMFRRVMGVNQKQQSNLAMMAFALVEVVMIVVGIVMANQLEEQKELREVTESAEVLFEEVMSNLEAEVLSANAVIQKNRTNNRVSDVVYNPETTPKEAFQNAMGVYFMVRFYDQLELNSRGYNALEKIHDRLPPHLLDLYVDLDLLMTRKPEIEENNKRFKEVVYANMEHNVHNYVWWNKSNYIGRPGIEFIEWMKTPECLAQIHLAVNSSAHLASNSERYRVAAIDLYNEIRSVLADTSAAPPWMNYGFRGDLPMEQLGTYVLEDKGFLNTWGVEEITLDLVVDQLVAIRSNGDTMGLCSMGNGLYNFPGPTYSLYEFPTDSTLAVQQFGVLRDWTYRKMVPTELVD